MNPRTLLGYAAGWNSGLALWHATRGDYGIAVILTIAAVVLLAADYILGDPQ